MPKKITESLRNISKKDFLSKHLVSGKYFFKEINYTSNEDIFMLCCGKELCSKNFFLDNHTNIVSNTIEFIVDGDWFVQSGDYKKVLRVGSIFIRTKKDDYTLKNLSGRDCIKYFLEFDGLRAEEILRERNIPIAEAIVISDSEWIVSLFDKMKDLSSFNDVSAVRMGNLFLNILIEFLSEDVKMKKDYSSASYTTFKDIKNYIIENYLTINNLDGILQKKSIHKAYLCALFNKYEQTTPLAFLRKLKLNHALNLIMRKKVSIKEASYIVGYENQYHFSKAFKSSYGLSPKKYLEKINNV
ncbi:MAG: AraC family transcriptional regulator [Opitutales bacterium]